MLPKLTALDNGKLVVPFGSEEKVLSQISLWGRKNRNNVKESKEPGQDGWGEKLGSNVTYKIIGSQHSKKSYERKILTLEICGKKRISYKAGREVVYLYMPVLSSCFANVLKLLS